MEVVAVLRVEIVGGGVRTLEELPGLLKNALSSWADGLCVRALSREVSCRPPACTFQHTPTHPLLCLLLRGRTGGARNCLG